MASANDKLALSIDTTLDRFGGGTWWQVLRHLDLDKKWKLRIWQLSTSQALPLHFVPRCVVVEKLHGVGAVEVWGGTGWYEQELQRRRLAKEQKQAEQRAAKRARKAGIAVVAKSKARPKVAPKAGPHAEPAGPPLYALALEDQCDSDGSVIDDGGLAAPDVPAHDDGDASASSEGEYPPSGDDSGEGSVASSAASADLPAIWALPPPAPVGSRLRRRRPEEGPHEEADAGLEAAAAAEPADAHVRQVRGKWTYIPCEHGWLVYNDGKTSMNAHCEIAGHKGSWTDSAGVKHVFKCHFDKKTRGAGAGLVSGYGRVAALESLWLSEGAGLTREEHQSLKRELGGAEYWLQRRLKGTR
jgi:hypothetical protein